ncbi:hypothetical protein DFH08DRAFT_801655 [Mycena albidolilacea]|uniref:Uncharacterized protein n=1 Tax=Mycena albidolilacea TaxID=1033008 RepID=A0AAD7EZK1_9AGAR|nr:hypothetical protein DFH08DRAFT_801655 [Mycena albidolilacea]
MFFNELMDISTLPATLERLVLTWEFEYKEMEEALTADFPTFDGLQHVLMGEYLSLKALWLNSHDLVFHWCKLLDGSKVEATIEDAEISEEMQKGLTAFWDTQRCGSIPKISGTGERLDDLTIFIEYGSPCIELCMRNSSWSGLYTNSNTCSEQGEERISLNTSNRAEGYMPVPSIAKVKSGLSSSPKEIWANNLFTEYINVTNFLSFKRPDEVTKMVRTGKE